MNKNKNHKLKVANQIVSRLGKILHFLGTLISVSLKRNAEPWEISDIVMFGSIDTGGKSYCQKL